MFYRRTMDKSTQPLMEDIHRVLQLLLYAQRGVTLDADSLLAEHGYDRAHFRILYIIGQLPGANLKNLVDGIGVSHQAVSQLLRKLIQDDRVFQTTDQQDKRKRHLFLTQSGMALREAVFNCQAEVISRGLKKIGADGVPIFLDAMYAMISDRDRSIIKELDTSLIKKDDKKDFSRIF